MWNILIVDDDFVNKKLLLNILKGKAECDVASNGIEAIEAYNASIRENKPYDVILLDIAMPEVNGIQVLEKIRENEEKAGILPPDGTPIIMVTAYKKPFIESFGKGCDDYLMKPIDAKLLIEKIEEKVKKK